MQWLEYGLAGLVGAWAVYALPARRLSAPWLRWFYGGVLLGVLAVQLLAVGPHWQVWPMYLAVAVLALTQYGGLLPRSGGWVALGLAVGGAGFCFALPIFELPRPTGPYAVGTLEEMVKDRSRGEDGLAFSAGVSGTRWRTLPVRLWYPAVAGTGLGRARYTNADEVKPLFRYKSRIRTNSLLGADLVAGKMFPVILYGPMWGGARVQNTFLAEELASHGYVVVAVDHPGNAALAETDYGVVRGNRGDAVTIGPGTTAATLEAAWAAELEVWTADDEAVLRETGERSRRDRFFAGLDLSRIGALGHSFGGASAMELLGLDGRVKSAVDLDGWTFGGVSHRTSQPVLFVYGGTGATKGPPVDAEGRLNADDALAVDGSLARYGGLRAYVAGAQHLDFTDQTLVSPLHRMTSTGPIAGVRMREITRGLVVGFFDQTLKSEGTVPVYPEVKLQHFSGVSR